MPSANNPSRNNRSHVTLFTLGVTTIKGTLFSLFKVEKPGAGYCHFPLDAKHNHQGYDAVYFNMRKSNADIIKEQLQIVESRLNIYYKAEKAILS